MKQANETATKFNSIGANGIVSAVSAAIKEFNNGLKKVTKQLKLQSARKGSDDKKLVISTNFLPVFGFEADARVVEEVKLGGGMTIRLANETDDETKKVYQRTYKNRKAAEAMLDIRSKAKLAQAFGKAERVHITFTSGLISIEPIFELAINATGETIDFTLPKDEDGLMSCVYRAVKKIEELAPSQITFSASEEVLESKTFAMFQVQIRRLGYVFEVVDGVLTATLPETELSGIAGAFSYEDLPSAQQPFRFNTENPYETMNVCTSGLDIASADENGFEVKHALEWRPAEKRDLDKEGNVKTDKHETGATCAIVNGKNIVNMYNEDLYLFDPTRALDDIKNVNILHGALCCTEHSNLKNKKARESAIESLATSVDMIFPFINIAAVASIPVVMIENVPAFLKSTAFKIFKKTMETMGYSVQGKVMNGKDHNAYTTRPRAFVIASRLNSGFSYPKAEERTAHFWNDIVVPNMAEIKATPSTENSVQTAIAKGRIRFAKEGDATAPTLMKSENKKTKDGTRIQLFNEETQSNWYYWPSLSVLRQIMSLGEDFKMDGFLTEEVKYEIVGQAVCMKTHGAFLQSAMTHINEFLAGAKASVKKVAEKASTIVMKDFSSQQPVQLALF